MWKTTLEVRSGQPLASFMEGRSVHFSTPQTEGCRRRSHAQTPQHGQSRHWRTHTPMRRTPYSRRISGLLPTSARHGKDIEVVEDDEKTSTKSLVNKTWRVYEVSPLYRFSQQPPDLKLFSRSLSGFLSTKPHGCECGSVKVAFSTLPELKSQPEDPACVQITVSGVRLDGGTADRVVLVAMLCGVGVAQTVNVAGRFSCLPVLLTRGAAQLTLLLLSWLEAHFDCHTTSLKFTPVTLTWMAAMWGPPSSTETGGGKPMELVYQFPPEINGLDRITYTVQSRSCHRLWSRIHPSKRGEEEEVTKEEVAAFIKSLEKHFHSCFHILLSRLTLCQVGTPAVQATGFGQIKMLQEDKVLQVLKFLCEVAMEKLFM